MKLTKTYLRKIIKEELREATRLSETRRTWRDGGLVPEPTYDSQTEDYLINDLDDLRSRVSALEDGIEMIMGQLTGRESQ